MPRSKEIPEDLRRKIIETYQAGNGYKNIAKILSIPKTTVRGIVCKWKRFGTITSLPRSGRPPKISPKGREIIMQEVMNNPCTTAKKLQATLASANIHVHDSTIRKVIIMHARPSLTCFGSSIDKTTLCQEDILKEQIKVEDDEQPIDGNSDMGSYDTEGCSGDGKNVSSDYITSDCKSERRDCDDVTDDDDDDSGSNIKRRTGGDEVITDNSICDKKRWHDADIGENSNNDDDDGWSNKDNDIGDKGDCDDQKCVNDIQDNDASNKSSNGDKIQDNGIDEGIKGSACVNDFNDEEDDEDKRSGDDNYFTSKLAIDKNEQSDETYGGDEIADNFGSDEDDQMSNHSVDDNTRADRAEKQKQSNHEAISDNEDQRKTVDDVENVVGNDHIQKTRHNKSHNINNNNNNNNNNASVEKHHGKDKGCATEGSKEGNWNSSDRYDIGPSTEFEANAFDYTAGSWDDWGWM